MIYKNKLSGKLINIAILLICLSFIYYVLYFEKTIMTKNYIAYAILLFSTFEGIQIIIKNFLLIFQSISLQYKELIITSSLTKRTTSIRYEDIKLLKIIKPEVKKPFEKIEIHYIDLKNKEKSLKISQSFLFEIFMHISTRINKDYIDQKSYDYVNQKIQLKGIQKILSDYKMYIIGLCIIICYFIVSLYNKSPNPYFYLK